MALLGATRSSFSFSQDPLGRSPSFPSHSLLPVPPELMATRRRRGDDPSLVRLSRVVPLLLDVHSGPGLTVPLGNESPGVHARAEGGSNRWTGTYGNRIIGASRARLVSLDDLSIDATIPRLRFASAIDVTRQRGNYCQWLYRLSRRRTDAGSHRPKTRRERVEKDKSSFD